MAGSRPLAGTKAVLVRSNKVSFLRSIAVDARTTKRGPSAEKPGLPVQRPEQLPPPKDRKTATPPPKTDDKKPSFRERLREHWLLATVAACLLVVAAIGGLLYWLSVRDYESTDDAFVAARSFSIAPKVGGYITDVPVTDNQHVNAGDLLAKVDDRDYRIAVDQAKAQVAVAEANITNINAQIDSQQEQIKQAQAQVDQAAAQLVLRNSKKLAPRTWSKKAPAPCRASNSNTPTCNRSRPTLTAPRPR